MLIGKLHFNLEAESDDANSKFNPLYKVDCSVVMLHISCIKMSCLTCSLQSFSSKVATGIIHVAQ